MIDIEKHKIVNEIGEMHVNNKNLVQGIPKLQIAPDVIHDIKLINSQGCFVAVGRRTEVVSSKD